MVTANTTQNNVEASKKSNKNINFSRLLRYVSFACAVIWKWQKNVLFRVVLFISHIVYEVKF